MSLSVDSSPYQLKALLRLKKLAENTGHSNLHADFPGSDLKNISESGFEWVRLQGSLQASRDENISDLVITNCRVESRLGSNHYPKVSIPINILYKKAALYKLHSIRWFYYKQLVLVYLLFPQEVFLHPSFIFRCSYNSPPLPENMDLN